MGASDLCYHFIDIRDNHFKWPVYMIDGDWRPFCVYFSTAYHRFPYKYNINVSNGRRLSADFFFQRAYFLSITLRNVPRLR